MCLLNFVLTGICPGRRAGTKDCDEVSGAQLGGSEGGTVACAVLAKVLRRTAQKSGRGEKRAWSGGVVDMGRGGEKRHGEFEGVRFAS